MWRPPIIETRRNAVTRKKGGVRSLVFCKSPRISKNSRPDRICGNETFSFAVSLIANFSVFSFSNNELVLVILEAV